ncbi:MAG: putative glycoside hydrolase, partial [bacterium]
MDRNRHILLALSPVILGVAVFGILVASQSFFKKSVPEVLLPRPIEVAVAAEEEPTMPEIKKHVLMPEFVKGIYLTAATASQIKGRQRLIDLVKKTELNTVVIDIKAELGALAYDVEDPELKKYVSTKIKIKDIDVLLNTLHEADIYVVGRLFVFQDPYLV